MANSPTAYLKSLHTAAIDAKNGYREALKEAEGHGLTGVFERMEALHARDEDELAAELAGTGEDSDTGGSVITVINKVIIDVRSLFGGLKESILPGLIDGESRILGRYDDALASGVLPQRQEELLRRQRNLLNSEVEGMRRARATADESKPTR